MLPLPAGREVSPGVRASHYVRHRPERTLLYQLVQKYFPAFKAQLSAVGVALPGYVEREFEDYLTYGRLEHGFLRVRCDSCHAEHLVAFSCKRRGFCPSCGARRMAESAALLVDKVLPEQPMRQWVLSFPFPLESMGSDSIITIINQKSKINGVNQWGKSMGSDSNGTYLRRRPRFFRHSGAGRNPGFHLRMRVLDPGIRRDDGGSGLN